MAETRFQKIYNQLNKSQKLAVDAIDGPVMVIAGPGTGKTQVLSTRIANILQKTDTPPDAILALTFTESAAKNMRERLTSIIGATAYYVNISTFHAFCTDIIRDNPDKFFVSLEAEPLSELEKIQIVQTILDHGHFDKLKPANTPYFYAREILRRLSELKREGVIPKEFAKIIESETKTQTSKKKSLSKLEALTEEKNLLKNKELLMLYEAYQKEIAKRSRFDFEDMINFVIQQFENDPEFLLSYQERFQYFLVDEYQDTNSAQNEVLRLLSSYWGEKANVFVVGDPNQSIYRFQGASLENILEFTKNYKKAVIIDLNENYRSTQTILDASNSLINQDDTKKEFPIDTKLNSQKKYPEEMIKILKLPSETVEEYFVVTEVKKFIASGVNPEEIAVLYRNNNDSNSLEDFFSRESILYNIEGGTDILSDITVNKLIKLFELIHKSKNQQDDLDLFTILHYEFWNLEPLDILKIARTAAEKKTHLIEIIKSPDFKKSNLVENPEKFLEILSKIGKWQKDDATNTFSHFFEIVLKESGYLDWILKQKDKVERLNRLNSLFSEIKSLNRTNHNLNLEQFLQNIELMRENNLKIQEEDLDLTKNAVTLSTVHKAKGKEWEYVFIIKAIDGKWGNNKKRELIKLPAGILKHTTKNEEVEKENLNNEERRLFYVALTRAKKRIYITVPETTNLSGRKRENTQTLFITEIDLKFLEAVTDLDFNSEKILHDLLNPLPPEKTKHQQLKEQEFLRKIVKDFKLSPTALNTYLECPYKFKLNNLIKIPRAKDVYLSFGSAVHKALELFYQKFKNDNKLPSKEYLLIEFEKALKKEILTLIIEQNQIQHGIKVLGFYYDYYKEVFTPALFTEKFFGYGYSKPYLNDIPLTGKVDRIDLLDRESKTAKVIDYKTGKPKSRNAIEGKTANADGGYKRQLVFYKLLTQLDHNFPLQIIETELDFVESDAYGKLKKESFVITQEEVDELKTTIINVMQKIRNLEFPRTKDMDICSHCDFKDHCDPEGIKSEL